MKYDIRADGLLGRGFANFDGKEVAGAGEQVLFADLGMESEGGELRLRGRNNGKRGNSALDGWAEGWGIAGTAL